MRLQIADEAVVCAAAAGEEWRVPLANLRVIGEFLTQASRRSPAEHFLVFMTKEEWFKIPYTIGREEVMADLSQRLNHPLRCELFNATNYSSRVLWPPHLEGQPLYDLDPEVRSPNPITRLRQMLLQKVQMRFTPAVRKELGHPES